jgi:uncharacterized protein (DUF1684 family)
VQEHARFLQQAAYIAWKTPRVRSLVHYQWIDEPVRYRAPGKLAYAGWQSGLHFVNGRPKPAMDSFPSPFVVAGELFWGQVRPGGAHRVTILQRGPDGQFAPVADAVTDDRGFFTQTLAADPRAEYRFTWEPLPSDRAAPQPAQRQSPPAVRVAR